MPAVYKRAETDMRNKSPIFINGFAGGGSNLLWNFLQSHPKVCSPITETHQIFTSEKARRRSGEMMKILTGQPRLFDIKYLEPRKPLSKVAALFFDYCLYKEKMKTLHHDDNKWKFEGIEYSVEEVKASRLISKNLNGIVFLTDILFDMYPDATFICLLRDGLALCESHLRHGRIASAREFGILYSKVAEKMIHDSETIKNYHFVKFEDLAASPLDTLDKLYSFASLDIREVKKLRLKAKRHLDGKGDWKSDHELGRKIWIPFEEVPAFIDPNVNKHHVRNLSEEQKRDFMEFGKASMEYFSYSNEL